MENPKQIPVEVAYALPEHQQIIALNVEEGCTVREAVERSGVLEQFPEIDLASNKMGIFGKLSKPDTVLRARDRVEIYRPLIADPKEVRKQRAAEGKRMKKGGGDADGTEEVG
jgi:putative ubiquitin-RnfH superfamily antitoxin RatB of RatAB toxin-antitoxin module